MRDVGEAVLAGDPVGPALDRRALDLDRSSAVAADEVMVVPGAALAVAAPRRRAPRSASTSAGVDERLEVAVDGRQPDLLAALLEDVVDLLRAGESVEVVEDGADGAALAGVAVWSRP